MDHSLIYSLFHLCMPIDRMDQRLHENPQSNRRTRAWKPQQLLQPIELFLRLIVAQVNLHRDRGVFSRFHEFPRGEAQHFPTSPRRMRNSARKVAIHHYSSPQRHLTRNIDASLIVKRYLHTWFRFDAYNWIYLR